MTTIQCPECEGYGEIRHPRWGSRSCPEPTIPCPVCGGLGEVSEEAAEDWAEHQIQYTGTATDFVPDPAYADMEEPF